MDADALHAKLRRFRPAAIAFTSKHAASLALGIPYSARTGGEDKPRFLYELWPGVPAVVNGITYPLQAFALAA